MRRWIAILDPANANRLLHEINLVPLQLDQLARPQPVSIGEQDRRGIAMPIATTLLGNRHQLFETNIALAAIGAPLFVRLICCAYE